RRVEADGSVSAEKRYESGAYATFDALVRDFAGVVRASGAPVVPPPSSAPEARTTPTDLDVDAACFAVAGPVLNGHAEVTNVGWKIEESSLARAFSIPRVALINDFYAVALGVPLLHDEHPALHRRTLRGSISEERTFSAAAQHDFRGPDRERASGADRGGGGGAAGSDRIED